MDSGMRGKGCEGCEDMGTLWYFLSSWNISMSGVE